VAVAAEPTPGALPARSGASPRSKRAANVAGLIVGDVIALGWPVGELLGSEGELLERYRVSRAVFREAVRLVEHQQVARMRRGPGGGLLVTEPAVTAVIDAVVLYLYRVQARLDELFEARMVLEEIITELAPARLDGRDLAELREFAAGAGADDPRALHALLASVSANPALELFVDVLSRVTMLYSTDWQQLAPVFGAEMTHAHARIAKAVIEGDAGRARQRMRRHLEAEFDFLRRRQSACQLMPDHVVVSGASNSKRAETVARHIVQAIVGGGMRPGEFIGAERDLIEQEGVSRAVLREAVRLLEHHQIARMRRGPGGGLIVSEPSASAVTEIAAIYLTRRGMRPADLAELRASVETALAGLAAERIDSAGIENMKGALDREQAGSSEAGSSEAGSSEAGSSEAGSSEIGPEFHAAVAGAAQSRVLELVALVLIRLSHLHQIERVGPSAGNRVRGEARSAHEGIAAAVASGDRERASHLMRCHLS
jgi:DNA-binding FadR family transcriptional regulator